MSYDSWKTTNPADQLLGPDPADEAEDDYRRALLEVEQRWRGKMSHWVRLTFAANQEPVWVNMRAADYMKIKQRETQFTTIFIGDDLEIEVLEMPEEIMAHLEEGDD